MAEDVRMNNTTVRNRREGSTGPDLHRYNVTLAGARTRTTVG